WLELGHHEARVGRVGPVEQGEADNSKNVLHLWHGLEQRFDLARSLAGARHRGAFGQLDVEEEVALVLLRQEGSRRDAAETEDAAADRRHRNERHRSDADQALDDTGIATRLMAMIGPVICFIASSVASCGSISRCSCMTRSTFSTTTMASSTTMPIARTIASNDTVLAE